MKYLEFSCLIRTSRFFDSVLWSSMKGKFSFHSTFDDGCASLL